MIADQLIIAAATPIKRHVLGSVNVSFTTNLFILLISFNMYYRGALSGWSKDNYYIRCYLLTDSYVVAVEPNPYFVELLLKKQKKYHNLKRIILGGAEDLSNIDNESIDAVVSTLVLCSVRHLDKTLQEVQRVLVKVLSSAASILHSHTKLDTIL